MEDQQGLHLLLAAARSTAALLALRDQVIVAIVAGIRTLSAKDAGPPAGPPWTATMNLRMGMQALFQHLDIALPLRDGPPGIHLLSVIAESQAARCRLLLDELPGW